MKSSRGIIQLWLLYVIGAAVATQLVPNWRISAWFAKGPQTEQLRKAEEALAVAKSDAAAKQAAYDAALALRDADTRAQTQYAQQMIAGVPLALKAAPPGPAVTLASALADRAANGLAGAIGDLSATKQTEIALIVADALSAKQAELDAARLLLAQRDAELAAAVKDKQEVAVQIPVLAEARRAADARADAAQGLVTAKTSEVAAFADKVDARDKQNGSLGALVEKLGWVIVIGAALYLVAHFMLPSLAQEYPAATWLVNLNRTVKSVSSAHL